MHRRVRVLSLLVLLWPGRAAAQTDTSDDAIPVCDDGSQWNPELEICDEGPPPLRRRYDDGDEEPAECRQLWAQSERSEADGHHLKAAESLVELYSDHRDECDQFGEHDQCEVLFRAGSLFEEDNRLGSAIQIWRRLFSECGDHSEYGFTHGEASPWAIEGVARIGRTYERIAAYTKAAQYYTEFGRRYPTHAEAPEALEKAARFRMALGQDDKAIEVARFMERHYAKSEQHRAAVAAVIFEVGQIFVRRELWPATRAHYAAFLKRYGRIASRVEVIEATTKIGMAISKMGTLQSPHSKRFFVSAIRLAEQSLKASDVSDVTRLRDAAAEARFGLAEHAIKQLVADSPIDLESASEQESGAYSFYWVEEYYVPWLDEVGQELAETVALYSAVATSGAPEWEVAAYYRMGQAYQIVGESMSKTPPGAHDMALDVLRQEGYELSAGQIITPELCRERAQELFVRCLDVAASYRHSSLWSRACAWELTQIDPTLRVDDEFLVGATYVPEMLALPKMIPSLPSKRRR